MSGYEEKNTQKQRLLEVFRQGKKVSQIDLRKYFALLNGQSYKSDIVDAIADLGIANLPARVFGLKEDGHDIKSEDLQVEGRFGKTHFSVYWLEEAHIINQDGQTMLFDFRPEHTKG